MFQGEFGLGVDVGTLSEALEAASNLVDIHGFVGRLRQEQRGEPCFLFFKVKDKMAQDITCASAKVKRLNRLPQLPCTKFRFELHNFFEEVEGSLYIAKAL
mmetsp:Transcript_92317/g.134953  ORF Transcript_92317/g.134953 Transcript_92317/m.134953 type:complete len:101 (-) Transcript_92317:343-645(-)